jgi:hypothetical protein
MSSIANNEKYWTKMECIQTNIRANQGYGIPIIVNFYAPVEKRDPLRQINYDFRSLGDDEDLIRNDSEMYCLKQCYKYCYFISKLHQIEILRMKCEFAQDYHGTIWFQYASDIFVRPNMDAKKDLEDEIARINKINKAHREKLIAEMESHKQQEEETRQHVDNLKSIMDDHYERMRKKAGIEEILDNSDGSDLETEEVFRKLYPDANHKLMDILTLKVKQPPRKSNTSRQLSPNHAKSQSKQIQYMNLNEPSIAQDTPATPPESAVPYYKKD